MTRAIIRRLPDAEQVSRTAAEDFVTLAGQAIKGRGRFTVALAGGSTPERLYQLLAEPPFRDQVDWPKVEFFWGDERAVAPDHDKSNYRMANAALLSKIKPPAGHVHRMQAERADRDKAAAEYQEEIARVFGVPADGEPPVFDLILLGMGPDGHTLSLFPQSPAMKEEKRWIVANYVAKFDKPEPTMPANRVTMTFRIANRCRVAMFLVAGADKTDMLVRVLEGPPDPENLPSQRIQPVSGELIWLLDEKAAAGLKRA
jgi:6-phosphogluconolactonase